MNPLKASLERHKQELLQLPNVLGVGVGPKVVAGDPTDQMAIKVFVSRKVPVEELKPDECVPASLDGFPTDVEVMGAECA